MPVTKTAKRALRGSLRKAKVNKVLKTNLEVAIRKTKKKGTRAQIVKAMSLADRMAKKGLIHKNKAGRLKSQLAKLLPKLSKKVVK